MESRAAVFTSQPQDVEVYSAGEWLPGSLLGWRHDAGGGCQVWVRLTLGGIDESLWTSLDCLRLPERHLAVAPEPAAATVAPAPAPADDPAATRIMRLAPGLAGGSVRRGRPPAPGARTSPAGERAVVRALPAVAPEVASRATHPAGRARRRADDRVVGETAEFPAVGAAQPGRHRAPASVSGAGRHRAADTGVWPVMADPASPAAEPDPLTRPMRLGGAVPRQRDGHRGDAQTGA